MKYGFGVDIGGTTIKIGLFSVEGDLIEKWEIPTNKTDNENIFLKKLLILFIVLSRKKTSIKRMFLV